MTAAATGISDPENQRLTAGAPVPDTPETGLLVPAGRSLALDAPDDRTYATDLQLDRIVASIAGDSPENELITGLFYSPGRDPATIGHRHDVFRDLENERLLDRTKVFTTLLQQVRAHLEQSAAMTVKYQREGWILDAASIYCDAVRSFADDLAQADLVSDALVAFRAFLHTYTTSTTFISLVNDTQSVQSDLARVRYNVRVRGRGVDVSRYDNEPDYSVQVLDIFDRFKKSATKDYRIEYRGRPGMNHVNARVVELVARLFPDEFTALDTFCQDHSNFVDPTIRRFEREIQFYLSYSDYLEPLQAAGLDFCYPQVSTSKDVFAADTFDLALADKLVREHGAIVRNDFHLSGRERIVVVSGPNQGGKTTFARTFGQLHHLAAIGYPVPGTSARLYLPDRIFTHFERVEDIANMRGKLEDDLVRIRRALLAATPDSVIIMNEIFTSTTLGDARFLGEKVLDKMISLGLLGIYVTFVDQLATRDDSIVSMVSTIVPGDPTTRTFKVVRGPADGLAYALAIAEQYGLTYETLRKRVIA